MAENKYIKSRAFKTALNKAKSILGDKELISRLLLRTQEKITNIDGIKVEMNVYLEKVYTFTRMIRAYATGKYRNIPVRSLVLMIAGLIYFINPVDFIPDFIPGLGLIDDMSVLLAIFNSIVDDVQQFREFESEEELQ